MKTLETQFSKGGFRFRQLNREGRIALFAKRRDEWPEHLESYEVVVVQRHGASFALGRQIEAGESMPSSETWGTRGWTFLDIDAAKTHFKALSTARQDADS